MSDKNSDKSKKRFPRALRRWLVRLTVIAAAVVLFFIFKPQILRFLGLDGTYELQMQNAVLGETRESAQLIVLEQDVEVQTEITSALADLDIFRKTKTIYSYGTGIYTVDLSQITAEGIRTNAQDGTVTITAPLPALTQTVLHIEQTQYEETDRGLLAFGEIKLTVEQQQLLQETILAAINQKLAAQNFSPAAEEAARKALYNLFQPLVQAVSGEYEVIIVFADLSETAQ